MWGFDLEAARPHRDAVVEVGHARFTVLTSSLIRLEYSPGGTFVDLPSLFAIQRHFRVPQYELSNEKEVVTIETEQILLRYVRDAGPFSGSNLSIEYKSENDSFIWNPRLWNRGNLGGTVRTLDECDAPLDLGEGLLSSDGWYLFDDTHRPLFNSNAEVVARPEPVGIDWYFFAYGLNYEQSLKDFLAIGGRVPLPPRYTFGSWYSRYWPYKSEELLQIADEYRKRGFPLDVMVIDMDWHLDGWTGYTWNKKLIPDPDKLLADLHKRGLKVTLNLHPADGIHAHEATYEDFARAMDVDPTSRKPIRFDCTDPSFMKNYFELLHHPLEKQGVDFWWIDWQQSKKTAIEGLDPLFMLNHLHFRDSERSIAPGETKRGMILSRWAGWGSHRYPMQFSGDTVATWKVLAFSVRFTTTAGQMGAGYWSHDLGGHDTKDDGRVDPELFVRWTQFGAFSPTMRLHSTRDPNNDRRPWLDGPPYEEAMRNAFALRYQLMPYVYTMARKCHDTGLPLCRPMHLAYPRDERAYRTPDQFMFGDDLLVAPVLEPALKPGDPVSVNVWLPTGTWYHLITHERFEGNTDIVVDAPLERIPVFVRKGAILPLAPLGRLHSGENLEQLHLLIHGVSNGEFTLYEDDGESTGYLDDEFATTRISLEREENQTTLTIEPRSGKYDSMPARRELHVNLHDLDEVKSIKLNSKPLPQDAWSFVNNPGQLSIELPPLDPELEQVIAISL